MSFIEVHPFLDFFFLLEFQIVPHLLHPPLDFDIMFLPPHQFFLHFFVGFLKILVPSAKLLDFFVVLYRLLP